MLYYNGQNWSENEFTPKITQNLIHYSCQTFSRYANRQNWSENEFPQKTSRIWFTSHVRIFQNIQMVKIGLKMSLPHKSPGIWYTSHVKLFQSPQNIKPTKPSDSHGDSKAPLGETFHKLLKNVEPFWHASHVWVFQSNQVHKIGLKMRFPQKLPKTGHVRVFKISKCTKLFWEWVSPKNHPKSDTIDMSEFFNISKCT